MLEPDAVLDFLGEVDDLLVREELVADGAPVVDPVPALHQHGADDAMAVGGRGLRGTGAQGDRGKRTRGSP